MKRILLSSVFALLTILTSCNKSNDNVTPSNNQKVLGLVLQANSDKLILLKDGRTISPVSGFNPENLRAGNKFNLSFTPIANQSSSKVIAVNVTSYTAANDSSFVPPPISGADSASVKTILQGTHSCVYTLSQVDNSNPGDSVKIVDQNLSINFDGNSFSTLNPPALPYYIPGGAGIFYFTPGSDYLINFVNEREFPQGALPAEILNGQWNIVVLDTYIMIWETDQFTTPQNKTIYEFGGFKINR